MDLRPQVEKIPEAELREMSLLLSALEQIPPQLPGPIRQGLIQGLLDHGRGFVGLVDSLARGAPERFGRLREQLYEIQLAWLGGEALSSRADEDDLRARHALWIADAAPPLARLAANAVMKLPDDHPLRDEEKVRNSLLALLRQAIEEAPWVAEFGSTPQMRADLALTALSGLLEHELAPADRLESLYEAGVHLLDTPLPDGGSVFRQAGAMYAKARAASAAREGDAEAARRWEEQAHDLLPALGVGAADPRKRMLGEILQMSGIGSSGDRVAKLREILGSGQVAPGADKIDLFAALRLAKDRYAERDFSEVVEILDPRVDAFVERYLTSLADTDIGAAGEELTSVCTLLGFSCLRLGRWDDAIRSIDRCKSLRFRFQRSLRRADSGRQVVELEAELHAWRRGVRPEEPGEGQERLIQASRQPRLLEVYRQVREQLGPETLHSPDLNRLSAALEDDEALAILGLRAGEIAVMVLRSDSASRPLDFEVLPSGQLIEALVGEDRQGWLIALGSPGIGVEPRPALSRFVEVADGVLGSTLRRLLGARSVGRLVIIPHKELHLMPYHALPSLERLEVMVAPSAAWFLEHCEAPAAIAGRALVVGNPTCDLELASVEARAVADRLSDGGFEVRSLDRGEATEERIVTDLADMSILHFTGHGLVELFRPLLSGLEVHPSPESLDDDGNDPLPGFAAEAEWGPFEDNERHADLGGGGRLHERLYPVSRTIELRLERGARGTLRGRYRWADEAEAKWTATRRLPAEVWTVGDILQEEALRDCRLAFLSSCYASLGQLSHEVDEFAGLPAGLDLAGVAAVISPLWPVDATFSTLFSELFYDDLRRLEGEVDLVRLIGRVRRRIRAMTGREAADRLGGVARLAGSRIERSRIMARSHKLRHGADKPFAHPYSWAAFQVTGSPRVWLEPREGFEARAQGPAEEADDSVLAAVAEEIPAPPAEPDSSVLQDGESPPPRSSLKASLEGSEAPSDEFDEAEAWETVLSASDDPNLRCFAAEARVKRGQDHLSRGRLDEALADFERAIELAPDSAPAHTGLGRTHRAADRRDAAVDAFSGALEIDPDAVQALAERALVWLQDPDRQEEGLADLTRAIELEPRWDAGWAMRADLLDRLGRHREALADHSEAIERRPEVAALYNSRSNCWEALGDLERTLADIETALFLRPREADFIGRRGYVHALRGDHGQAIADYDASLAIDPSRGVNYFNRACSLSVLEERRGDPPAGGKRQAIVTRIGEDLIRALELGPWMREKLQTESELRWARENIPEVRRLLESG